MKNRSIKSDSARQRLNLYQSLGKLARVLEANFTTGDTLVTLAYDGAHRPRSRELAACYLRDWLETVRGLRSEQGQGLRYVYGTDCGQEDGGPIHRVVLVATDCDVAAMVALWPYGRASAERLELGDGCRELASLLMREAVEAGHAPVPCGRMWVPSVGLERPGRPHAG